MKRTLANVQSLSGVLLAITSIGCAGPAVQVDETTEKGHLREAATERREARVDERLYNPKATVEREVGPAGPAALEGGGMVLVTHNPTSSHLADADAHKRHAAQHEHAAALLADYEAVECRQISVHERGTCPTLQMDALTTLPKGVRLQTGPLRLAHVLADIRCQLAFAQVHGTEAGELCPLSIPGVTARAAADEAGIELVSDDPKAVAALHALVVGVGRGM